MESEKSTFKLPALRWWIAGFLCLLSILNYIDRQALSILATVIQKELNLSDMQYGQIGQAFLLCYAAAYFLSGRVVDRYGPRIAETLFISVWSLAGVLTSLVSGFFSLLGVRALLGMSEPGHYSVSAKVVGSWFPAKDKGIAVGMYVMGGTLGAAVAAPLVTTITYYYGWRAAFVITGGLGFFLAAGWWFIYRQPGVHPWLTDKEKDLLDKEGLIDNPEDKTSLKSVSVKKILTWKPLWLLLAVRALTDPIWHFYLIWFAKYQQEVREFSLLETGSTLWMIFVTADIGCILAGFLSGWLIKKGSEAHSARMKVMLLGSLILSCSFIMPMSTGKTATIALGCFYAFAIMLFMTNAVTLVVDIIPRHSLGTSQGIIGLGGSLSAVVTTGLTAWAVTNYSYDVVFQAMSLLHPLAIIVLFFVLKPIIHDYKFDETN
ncbi:MAG: MFS transporter [Lentisphaeraceae bacterium]|nr:MFS transporter [Lentisphaeraceae bacterium]